MKEFLFGLVLCGVGIAVCGVAIALAIRSRRILRSWPRANAVVVASDFGSAQLPARNATATFEFQDHSGATRRGTRQGYRSVGAQSVILFNPAKPSDIRVVNWNELWSIPVILAVLGATVLTFGICVLAGFVPVE